MLEHVHILGGLLCSIHGRRVSSLPRTDSGKIRYRQLSVR